MSKLDAILSSFRNQRSTDHDEHPREKRSNAIVPGKYRRARDQGSSLVGHCRQAIVWERMAVNTLYYIVGVVVFSLFSVVVLPILVAIFFAGLAGVVARVGRWKIINGAVPNAKSSSKLCCLRESSLGDRILCFTQVKVEKLPQG